MLPFATEFPVRSVENRASFLAEVCAWLYGMSHSTVLGSTSETDLDGENAHLKSATGEELRLRELGAPGGWEAIGFRHDLPDHLGRLWRTEGVLQKSSATEREQDFIRVRTQCIARKPGALLDTPRKPYLIKSLLKDGWGGSDGKLNVSDQPIWLESKESDLHKAKEITLGDSSKYLPVLYISADENSRWALTRDQIEKIAYDLGGVAHVTVEPSREFSFRLRDATDGRNAYNGTVGLILPQRGMIQRYYLGWRIQDSNELLTTLTAASLDLRGTMPSFGWDWTELQEQALRAQRERAKSKLKIEEIEELYQEEIENLQEKISQLSEQIKNRPRTDVIEIDERQFLSKNFIQVIGPEIYTGEISDRLRLAAETTISCADQIGLDKRSKAILEKITTRIPPSPELSELIQDLERATKNPKRAAQDVATLMCRHGYEQKSEKRHVKLEPAGKFEGLETIVMPKTPGDHRSTDNLRQQIFRILGLSKIKRQKT